MKVKKLILVTEEEYENIDITYVDYEDVLDCDNLRQFMLGDKTIIFNTNMIVTIETGEW